MFVASLVVGSMAIGYDGPNLFLEHLLDKHRGAVPGAVACLVRDGSTAAVAASGYRRYGGSYPIGINDKIRIGSVAKPVTGTLVAVAIAQTDWTFNTKIGDVWPGVAGFPGVHDQYANATIAHLITHQAGFHNQPEYDPSDCFASPTINTVRKRREAFAMSAMRDKPLFALGQDTKYSGCGTVILGAMMERKFNDTYPSLLKKKVFDPLRMTNSGVGMPWNPTDTTGASGVWQHTMVNGKPKPKIIDSSHSLVHAPAGNIYVSAVDMGKFIASHLPEAMYGTRILSKSMLNEMHDFDKFSTTVGGFGANMSLTTPGLSALWHNGDDSTQYADLYISPSENYGFFIAANISSKVGPELVAKMYPEIGAMYTRLGALTNYHREVHGHKSVSATSKYSDEFGYSKAHDSSFTTRWSAKSGVKQCSYVMQLPAHASINGVMLDEEGGRIRDFQIETRSSINQPWKVVAKGKTCGPQRLIMFPAHSASYVRLNVLNAVDGPSLWEFHVYKSN